MGDIGKEIEELKFTQKEMMRDIRTLEIRTTITEKIF